ncbi:hypothetical protein, partial [Burkholderia pseudomallei]|uniref:hypothetical protein n=1 Tax=Burkholderia pseudomallei TaxID=28450 RepID=UPI001940331C
MPPVACITGAAAQPVPPFAPAPPFSFFAPPEATGKPPPRRGSIAPQLKKRLARAFSSPYVIRRPRSTSAIASGRSA